MIPGGESEVQNVDLWVGKDSGKGSGVDSGKDSERFRGWTNPSRKVVPGGEFEVENVDLWAPPHGELGSPDGHLM